MEDCETPIYDRRNETEGNFMVVRTFFFWQQDLPAPVHHLRPELG
jgi:hypothetical protein